PVHLLAARVLLGVMLGLLVAYMVMPEPFMPFTSLLILFAALSLIYGALFTLPIGGADMPVLICFLVALHGVVALLAGLFFQDTVMLIGGVLVGATGPPLTLALRKAIDRRQANVPHGVSKGDTAG